MAGRDGRDLVQAALDSMAEGLTEEEAARSLTWRDFERFCAELLRAAGYSVRENIYLKRPRAQLDLVGYGHLYIINLDCKRWKRAPSHSALEGFAAAQLRRSRLIRRSVDDPRPVVSAVLALAESEGSFVQGVAVVPLRAFDSFLTTLESYIEMLELA